MDQSLIQSLLEIAANIEKFDFEQPIPYKTIKDRGKFLLNMILESKNRQVGLVEYIDTFMRGSSWQRKYPYGYLGYIFVWPSKKIGFNTWVRICRFRAS